MSKERGITYHWGGVFTAGELTKYCEVENITQFTTEKIRFKSPQQELVERARAGLEVYRRMKAKKGRHWFSDAEDKTILQKYPGEVKAIEELAQLFGVPKIAIAYRLLSIFPHARLVYNGYDGPFADRETKKEVPQFKQMVDYVVADIRSIIEEQKKKTEEKKKNYSKEKFKWAHIRVAKNVSLRKWVFNRDGNRCIADGSTDKLVLEHIIPTVLLVCGGAEVKDTFAPFNLATLCKECSLLRHRPRKLLWDEKTLELLKERRRRRSEEFSPIDGAFDFDEDVCKKYQLDCSEAFYTCAEDKEQLYRKYPNCEGCPYSHYKKKSKEEQEQREYNKQVQEERKIDKKFRANLERIKEETKERRHMIEVALSDSWNFYSAYPNPLPTPVEARK